MLRYTYKFPRELADGWKTDGLVHAQADEKKIKTGIEKILDGSFPDINSLLVVRGGRLVLEEYFNGQGPDIPRPIFSVTKSVFSLIFGIAQNQGLFDVNKRLYDFFPEYREKAEWDPRKDRMTLGMLLSMSSGYNCHDMKDSCGSKMIKSPDWLAYSLSLPLENDPGTHFNYCGTACLTPLGVLTARFSGLTIPEFAQKHLFQPLGIQGLHWEVGPKGVFNVSWGHWMKPRDMAKLGLLVLNKGAWEGREIIPQKWTDEILTPQAPRDSKAALDYGYLWWIREVNSMGRKTPVFYANGYDMQFIFLVPEFDLVCVITGGNGQHWGDLTMAETFFQEYILAAI